MFQTKDSIDNLCETIVRKVKDEKERKLSYYTVALHYSQAKEHELARKYVLEYLIVQEDSASAYELLGQSCEALGQKGSALEAYKQSFRLDDKQNHLLPKICELLIDEDVSADSSQLPYWAEKAASKYSDHPVILMLKEKIINSNGSDNSELKELRLKISKSPSDVNLDITLIKRYISQQRIEDAFAYATQVQPTDAHYNSLTWYELFYNLLTKMKIHHYSSVSFWISLMFASERYASLSLVDFGNEAKKISDVAQVLFNFDQDLYEAESQIYPYHSSVEVDEIFDNMCGQLNYHLGCFWLRSVKAEVAVWLEVARSSYILFFTAAKSKILERYSHARFREELETPQWLKEKVLGEICYRLRQSRGFVKEYIKSDVDFVMKIKHYVTKNSGQEDTYRKIFADRCTEKLMKTSYFLNSSKKNLWKLLTSGGLTHSDEIIYSDTSKREIIKPPTSVFRFVKPPNTYIPREIVIRSDSIYKKLTNSLVKKNFTVNPNSINDKEFVYAAVENGHLPVVLQLLELGIDVNFINPETGLSLLATACLNNYPEIVKILLKYNVDVNIKILSNNQMPVDQLRTCSSIHGFNRLLALFCSEENLCEVTCLHLAVCNCNPEIVNLLLQNGATLADDPTFFKITCIAIRKNCEPIVRMFLRHGLNVTEVDPQGQTLLHCCVNSAFKPDSRYAIAQRLFYNRATVPIQSPEDSFFYAAIKGRHFCIVQLFLSDISVEDIVREHKKSLLHKDLRTYMDEKYLKILLDRKIPINAVDSTEVPPLIVACNLEDFRSRLYTVKALLKCHVNVNCVDDNGWTPLHFAVSQSDPEVTRVLLEHRADPNVADNNGRTPLHVVWDTLCFKSCEIIKLLLQYNANIEAEDKCGETPLFRAISFEHHLSIEYLLANNANINHINAENETPLLNIAKKRRLLSSMLLNPKTDIFCVDKLGNSVLHIIVSHDQTNLVKDLAQTQIDFNSVNLEGNTPLHIAVEKNLFRMTELLIKYGSDINIVDKDNETPLQKAVTVFSRPIDDYDEDQRQYCFWDKKRIIELLEKHVVKLKLAGLKVALVNFEIVFLSKDRITNYLRHFDNSYLYVRNHDEDAAKFNALKEICQPEIDTMEAESISSTGMIANITVLDLLKKSIHYLSRYVENTKVQETLDQLIESNRFPQYIDIITSRFRDAKIRRKLIPSAMECFRMNVHANLPDNCIDELFSYLDIQELQVFMKACVDQTRINSD